MNAFVHQVEMKLPEPEATERLRRIQSWCADWEIGFRMLDRQPYSESVRLAFEDRRLARAFIGHFGGVLVDELEVEDAMAADAAFEDVYERLAREFNA
ncbi:hypothetical protein [Bosea sp. (in: a-proteobacteria)]|uniref:hypothetical protein n=1 Tax=Bosea sp. (in: a-proteobacteria) TaxID=1871050 RepID=UPI00122C066B|nr:hypothetical protein [Bosea sp. (in: a-proteobacteria)]TAJ27567.1 MAG: hypothetical protein EPO59_21260 [Bosea sp. (in: a-proteobacteria)]